MLREWLHAAVGAPRGNGRRLGLVAATLWAAWVLPFAGLPVDWAQACAPECCPLEGPSCCCQRPVWRAADGSAWRPPGLSDSHELRSSRSCAAPGVLSMASVDAQSPAPHRRRAAPPRSVGRPGTTAQPLHVEAPSFPPSLPRPPPVDRASLA